jgi:hypothetical protein
MLKSNVYMQGNLVTHGNHHAVTFYIPDNGRLPKMVQAFDQAVAQAPAQTSGANSKKTGANEWNLEFGLPKKAQISRIVE